MASQPWSRVPDAGTRVLLSAFLAASLLLIGRTPLVAQTALRDGWKVQSSAKVPDSGEKVSLLGYSTPGWYLTSVPKTVFAVLVENGVYKHPYYGMNLRSFPGVEYNIGTQFANQEMSAGSPYAVPWWYRKEFDLPPGYQGKQVWIE